MILLGFQQLAAVVSAGFVTAVLLTVLTGGFDGAGEGARLHQPMHLGTGPTAVAP